LFGKDRKNGTDGKDRLLAFVSTSIFKLSRSLFLFGKEGTDCKNGKDLLLLAILGFCFNKDWQIGMVGALALRGL
jgi:hypothetical protein